MSYFECRNLGKRFKEGKRSFYPFRKVNLVLPDKGLFSIRGKSGSGKSTLLNLLAGFLPPDEGSVIYRGRDLSKMKPKELEDYRLRSIGVIYQHYNLLPGLSAFENIALPMKMTGANGILIKKRITSLAKRFRLESLLRKKVDRDSGGEKQRIAILRALANNPEVILADEPTGALDEANSKLVMEMLKEISKDRLVVMVSHNENLISQYSDGVYEIAHGTIDHEVSKEKTDTRPRLKKKKRGDGWLNSFVRRHLFQDRFLNAFSFLACFVGLLSLLFSAGFYVGSETCGEEARWANLEAYTFNVSMKEYQEVEGSPLKLVHSKRPKYYDVLETLPDAEYQVCNDYSYFLPDSHSFFIDGKAMEMASFRPVYYHDDSLLIDGDFPFGSLVANEEMMAEFPDLRIGSEIRFEMVYSINRFGAKDEGSLNFAFVLSGVVHEFSFLNTPKFYYDYGFLASKMKETKLENISSETGKDTTIESLVSNLGGEDSATAYSYYVFAKDKNAASLLETKKNNLGNSSLSLDGPALASYEAYSSLMEAFLLSLLLFVGIAFLGVFFIVAMTSYSSFAKRRKEAAIFLALGARKGSVKDIYAYESVFVGGLSAAASLACFPIVAKLVNSYLGSRFSLAGLIAIPYKSFLGYSFLLPVLIFIFSIVTSFLSTSLSLGALRRLPLATVLRDE